MRKTIITILWSIMAILILGAVTAFVAIWNGWIGYMPDIEDLQNPISKYASQIYSADGKLMGTWNISKGNRVMVDYNNLSPDLVTALVATEDERFYEHSGIDFKALGRAIVKRGFMRQTSAGGGSTITQQLAKQLYTEKKASTTFERLLQKPFEWVIAIKLERYYTKEEIITMYLNYFNFLYNAEGIKTAAKTYFNKDPKYLTLDESAMLIGMCKNPAYFNPKDYPERSKERRDVVLAQMYKAGYITRAEHDAAVAKPLEIHFHMSNHKEGIATYFREFMRQYLMAEKPEKDSGKYKVNPKQFIIDSIAWENDPVYGWCNKNFKRNGEPYNIYTDGLKIYTTIDSRMQRYAEEAVIEHLSKTLQPAFNQEIRYKKNAPYSSTLSSAKVKQVIERTMRQTKRYRVLKEAGATDGEINKSFRTPVKMTIFTYHGEKDTVMSPMDSIMYYKRFLRSGFMSMDAHTGAVKAYVGGLDFSFFQYDMGMLGRRQIGSTTKPYLYALSVENGLSPCDPVSAVAHRYGNWMPRGGARGGSISLKTALQTSNNTVSAYLMNRLAPGDYRQSGVIYMDMLNKFGINTPGIEPGIVLCLGPNEVSVGEMVSAYTTFPNRGIHCFPMFITQIEDSHGDVVAQFQPRMNEVISESSAYKMIVMLQAVVDGGTGSRMRNRYNVKCEMGGKTGTSNDNSDGWFIGFTPSLVSGGWVGGEDRDIHFDNGSMGQGASMALPIWAHYMKRVFADKTLGYKEDEKFDMPDGYNPCATEHSSGDEIMEVYE